MDADRSTRSDASDRRAADRISPAGGAAGALFAGLVLAAVGCTETEVSVTNPTETARLDVVEDVSEAPTSSASEAGGTRVARNVTIDGETDFVVESVDAVMHELQVAREGAECAFGQPGSGTGGDDGTDCLEVHVGIRVDTLPTDDGSRVLVNDGQIEPGTLDRMVFRFDVVEQNSDIPARPDLVGGSVRITGTFGGEDFEILLAPQQEVSVAADTPLTIGDEESGEMTLHWAVATWFDDGEGGVVDPVAASADDSQGQALRDQIVTNIEDALEVRTSSQ